MNGFPVITLIVASMAALVASSPDMASALVYDRDEILSGELWRIVTCNWVHFSKSHFVYDLIAFAIAGSLVEARDLRGFGRFCLLAPAVIGLTVLVTQPNLTLFGGLSGVATGAIVFLALHGLEDRGPWRWICLLALAAVAAKTLFEFATGQLAFAQSEAIALKPVPASHVAGALVAIFVYLSRLRPPSVVAQVCNHDQTPVGHAFADAGRYGLPNDTSAASSEWSSLPSPHLQCQLGRPSARPRRHDHSRVRR